MLTFQKTIHTYLDPNSPHWPQDGSSRFGDPFGPLEPRKLLGPPLLNITIPDELTVKYDSRFFVADDIAERGVCQASPNRYQWGFSFHLTFAYLVTSTILALALYIIWLRSGDGKELADTIFGDLKTAVVVAQAVDEVTFAPASQMREKALQMLKSEQRVGVDLSRYVVEH